MWRSDKHAPSGAGDSGGSDEQDYLSRLAESVLKRQKPAPAPPPPARDEPPRPAPSRVDIPKIGSTAPQSLTPPSASSASVPRLTAATAPVAEDDDRLNARLGQDGTFPVGTILRFEDETLAVFKDSRPDKDYEVILVLMPDGQARTEGVALYSYDVKPLGKLPPDFMLRLQRRQRWIRDEILFHLDHYDYCALIPQIQSSPQHAQATPLPRRPLTSIEDDEGPKKLSRGRRITVSFGPGREWNAVYWGEDDLGPVLAHQTHEKWALMHLDLERFRDSLRIGELIDDATRQSISRDLTAG